MGRPDTFVHRTHPCDAIASRYCIACANAETLSAGSATNSPMDFFNARYRPEKGWDLETVVQAEKRPLRSPVGLSQRTRWVHFRFKATRPELRRRYPSTDAAVHCAGIATVRRRAPSGSVTSHARRVLEWEPLRHAGRSRPFPLPLLRP